MRRKRVPSDPALLVYKVSTALPACQSSELPSFTLKTAHHTTHALHHCTALHALHCTHPITSSQPIDSDSYHNTYYSRAPVTKRTRPYHSISYADSLTPGLSLFRARPRLHNHRPTVQPSRPQPAIQTVMAESQTAAAAAAAAAPASLALAHDSREYAQYLTDRDPLRHLRGEFLIPSKADLASQTLPAHGEQEISSCHVHLHLNLSTSLLTSDPGFCT